jgi:hypothetical protein
VRGKKNSREGFLAWRRGIGQGRIKAIISGRKSVDYRPTEQEIKESEERWEAERHQIPD